jgi:ABC-type multidrug transport system fused ATPase/permease subunit
MIAHCLHTLISYDIIFVLEHGKLMELRKDLPEPLAAAG